MTVDVLSGGRTRISDEACAFIYERLRPGLTELPNLSGCFDEAPVNIRRTHDPSEASRWQVPSARGVSVQSAVT